MRRRHRAPAVYSHDALTLRVVSLRTRFLRVLLAVGSVALLVIATASARGLNTGPPRLLSGSAGILVVDLSASIGEEDYGGIRRTVRRLIDEDASVGLVVFSDVGYELLPPGTPASELQPLLRLLVPRRETVDDAGLPVNPWAQSFRAGTRISSALALARDILVRDKVKNGFILLASDLVTAPEDIPELARTLNMLRRQSIPIRVVALSPLRDGRSVFEGLLGKSALIEPSQLRSAQPVWEKRRVELPTVFLVLGGLLFGVLAVHERFAGRLGLPHPQKRPA
jgi:hypothetical protein